MLDKKTCKPIAKSARRKYDLEKLLAKLPKNYEPEVVDWGKPVGKEIW